MSDLTKKDVRTLLRELGDKKLFSISQDAHVKDDLIDALEEHDVSALVVLGQGGRLVGIVTERDIVRKAAGSDRINELLVRDIMAYEDLETVTPMTTLGECENIMKEKRIRHLPVIENGEVIAVISIRDLMVSHRRELENLVNDLHGYIRRG